MFRFANPHMLWLLVLIPAVILVMALMSALRRRALDRFGQKDLVAELMPDVSVFRQRLRSVLFILALTFVILALARPQFGSRLSEQKAEGVEMMLAVDVSNSMLAEDLSPSRLDRTKYSIDRLFASLTQDRVGLVVFAGEAKVQLPITSDYRMARSFAKKLSTDMVGAQGTDLGKAIQVARMSFSSNEDSGKVLILITDGEDHDQGALDAAKAAADQGIRIFAVGIGTPEGAPIRIDGEMMKDDRGEMVVTKLNEDLLKEITSIGKGGYIRATSASFGLEEISDEINAMKKAELTSLRFEEFNESFYWMLAFALVLLVTEGLVFPRRNHRLKRYNIFS